MTGGVAPNMLFLSSRRHPSGTVGDQAATLEAWRQRLLKITRGNEGNEGPVFVRFVDSCIPMGGAAGPADVSEEVVSTLPQRRENMAAFAPRGPSSRR